MKLSLGKAVPIYITTGWILFIIFLGFTLPKTKKYMEIIQLANIGMTNIGSKKYKTEDFFVNLSIFMEFKNSLLWVIVKVFNYEKCIS